MSVDMNKAINLRSKCGHFRILVIGRANAGKTTLLKRVCGSTDDPEIFGPKGKKLKLTVVEGSAARGLNDIENQLIFKSNPQFIFHDSRGFESGSIDETKKTWTQIGNTNRLDDFFNFDVTGKVPLIAIFTKSDGLVTKAFNKLKASGASWVEARKLQAQRAQEMLDTYFIERLKLMDIPSLHLYMRKETSSCIELIEKTAKAVTDDILRLLFVSVQQNNIDLCIELALDK
ncbi:GTP-binding protein [Mycena olivaceomarginata]|nr:GTP-binding protein [Mycena olivaceomarginata]